MNKRVFTLLMLAATALLVGVRPVWADWVGMAETTKFMESSTVNQIIQRYQQGQPGLQAGDTLSYIIEFTPTNNGGTVGAGAYVMDYIPPGTEVVAAEFVQPDGTGGYVAIQPATPAPVKPPYLQMYGDTGIFYSTDPRTARYINPAAVPAVPYITSNNGYALPATVGATPLTSSHNAWDLAMVTAYSGAARVAGVAPPCAPLVVPLGSGPAAGPDAFLKLDSTGAVGPWQRVSYPGSVIGTATGVATTSPAGGCVGGTPTNAGWSLSPANPLPAGTNAVRWVAGSLTVGQLFYARIKLRLTQTPPTAGIINDSEVFGGDTSSNAGVLVGKDNMWKYHSPSVASNNSNLVVVKRLVGMCIGAACVPQPYSGGTIPSAANLKLRYQVVYANTAAAPQTNVTLSDVLPLGAALVAATVGPPATSLGNVQFLSGPNLGVIQTAGCLPVNGVAQSACFAPIPTLGSGFGGSLTYDVNFAAAPAANTIRTNTVNLVSAQLPNGVTSVVPVTAVATANLVALKTTSTPTASPGGIATYQITLTNGGAAAATAVSVTDYLPNLGAGATALVADRFSYQVGSITATQTVAGVTSPLLGVTATVGALTSALSPSPYNVAPNLNREPVTFALGAASIAAGGSVTLTFNALVGGNIPSSPTPYTNDVNAIYTGGVPGATAGGMGYAPVTVTTPLTLTKTIDCVYVGLVCQPYANGPIPTASKIRYRLSYANTGAAQNNVVITDTLPANTSFVIGTAAEVNTGGNTVFGIVPPTAPIVVPPARQLMTFGTIATLPAGAQGAVTFDVQLGAALVIPSGSYIVNDAKMVSTAFPGGSQASLTTSVRDVANVIISKTTSTPTIAPNGTATYTITATNTGSQPATAFNVYDFLPFSGTVANANLRFNYLATTSVTLTPAGGGVPVVLTVVPTTTIGALNQAPHNANLNQQQVGWNFATALPTGLAAGDTVTIVFTAQPFVAPALNTALAPSNIKQYFNDIQASYQSGAVVGVLNTSVNGTAPVKIPTNLAIVKSIDCVYSGLVCQPYSGSGIIPNLIGTKVRYKIIYSNTSATTAIANLTLTDTLPTFTTPASTMNFVAGSATLNAVPVVPTQLGQVLTFPGVASLAAGASNTVTLEATLGAALVAGTSVLNTATVSYVLAGITYGETGTVIATATPAPDLVISKTTSTPTLAVGGATASYTITVSNQGTAAATGLMVYDFLPFSGTTNLANMRFNFNVGSSVLAGAVLPVPIVTTTVPPTVIPYDSNPNQQQVTWDFGAGSSLAAGTSFTITFTAAVGTAMPAGSYVNRMAAIAGNATSIQSGVLPTVTLTSGKSISGVVYSDANHNTLLDSGETWAAAPTVYAKLFAGACPAAGTASAVQTIAASTGAYTFTGVSAGNYCVVLSNNATASDTLPSVPAGWQNSMPSTGMINLTVSTLDVLNQNFGLFSGTRLSGRVFKDIGNGGGSANDGVQNGAELGMNGVTVTANQAGCAGTLCASAVTDANGDYVMWLPTSVTGALTLTETNLTGFLSTGGQVGNTAGSYTRSTDTSAFTVTPGSSYSAVNFADVPDNQWLTDGAQSAMPGSAVLYPHTFIAGTAGNVAFAVAQQPSPALNGWSEVLYVDTNCNAQLDAGEGVVPATMPVTAGQTLCLLVKEFVPAGAPLNAQNALTVTANFTSSFSGVAVNFSYVRHDVTTVGQPNGSGLVLLKSVDTATALPGGNITYTVAYTNNSSGILSNVVISDVTPSYTVFQSANCGVLPLNLSACAITAPAVGGAGAITYTMTGTLAPTSSGAVTFTVQVIP